MKKLLLAAVVGLAALSVTPAPSQAGTFGLIPHHCFGCCDCCCSFKIRQYNAFTPVCSGNITCMGCAPLAVSPPFGIPATGGPGWYGSNILGPADCGPCDSSCAPAPAPAPAPQSMVAPPAQPTPAAAKANPYAVPSGAVQAGYKYPSYIPGYTPYYGYGYGYPQMGATPYYWNAR